MIAEHCLQEIITSPPLPPHFIIVLFSGYCRTNTEDYSDYPYVLYFFNKKILCSLNLS